jgi:predicted DNA-binding transcriptional regulator YafY
MAGTGMECRGGTPVSQLERVYKLSHLLSLGQCLPKQRLLDELGVSFATLKRDLQHMRDRMNQPVVFDRQHSGWRLDRSLATVGTQYELPGLWLSAEEIHALLTMQHLLTHLDAGGLLGRHIAPLADRLASILGDGTGQAQDLARRIRVQTVGARQVHLPHFQAVGSALLRRLRLVIDYHGRGRGETRQREVSPQRLIHYRDNWYLDAWCHLRKGLRSFSVDAIRTVRVLDKAAIEIPDTELDEVLGAGYGIFAGREVQWATLRFSAERARWVASESWHPQQRGRFDDEGRWLLELPYSDPRELVMDILRHVPQVQVLGPQGLREMVLERLRAGVEDFSAKLTQ